MRKCEKILFNTIEIGRRHEACKAFLDEERKLQIKNRKQKTKE